MQKSGCQNLIMDQSYGHCKIILPAFLILTFVQYGHILGKTPCSGPRRRPGQASPWGHSPSSSAPAVPMRLSRIDQHIKDEPCAKQRALLGIFSSRYFSRFSRYPISWSIFSKSPLERILSWWSRPARRRSHTGAVAYTKNTSVFSKIKNRYFCLFFSRKPNSFRGPGGFCWRIGVTAALLGRLLPSNGHKLVKKPEI
jgi:hypothetical protein